MSHKWGTTFSNSIFFSVQACVYYYPKRLLRSSYLFFYKYLHSLLLFLSLLGQIIKRNWMQMCLKRDKMKSYINNSLVCHNIIFVYLNLRNAIWLTSSLFQTFFEIKSEYLHCPSVRRYSLPAMHTIWPQAQKTTVKGFIARFMLWKRIKIASMRVSFAQRKHFQGPNAKSCICKRKFDCSH